MFFQFYLTCASRFIFQRVKNLETTLKRWNNLFQGFISVLFWALEIKHFISVLLQFYFMLCESLKTRVCCDKIAEANNIHNVLDKQDIVTVLN